MAPIFSTSSLTRRSFVKAGLGVGALAGLDGLLPAYAKAAGGLFRSEMPISRVEFDLAVGSAGVTIDGKEAVAQTLNGSIPGPLLRFREGETAVIRVRNDLDDVTAPR